jgi:hypothetical protein
MITPKYLVRLDDAHPNMHIENWVMIESIMDLYNIKPIVGVIPKNQDLSISFPQTGNFNFWDKVCLWKSKGWTIAVHGLNHRLENSGRGIFPVNDISEFVGRSYENQYAMIQNAISIFDEFGLNPTVWMSPAHGMDFNTIKALRSIKQIQLISDGFSFRPYKRYGFGWIPQQLWRGRRMLFGTWTICLHPSSLTLEQIDDFHLFVKSNTPYFVSADNLEFHSYSVLDWLFEKSFIILLIFKKWFKKYCVKN